MLMHHHVKGKYVLLSVANSLTMPVCKEDRKSITGEGPKGQAASSNRGHHCEEHGAEHHCGEHGAEHHCGKHGAEHQDRKSVV